MLEAVKNSLGITGPYQDTIIQGWIDEIKQLMIDGGIPSSIVNDKKSAGVIAKGIDDLYFQKSNLSEYFWQRAIQLAYKDGDKNE
ncbi:MAG: hypothetical protein HFJ20_06345 [Clostridia bacterium]|nr:hypothetical protein [Clostridia bacterium]